MILGQHQREQRTEHPHPQADDAAWVAHHFQKKHLLGVNGQPLMRYGDALPGWKRCVAEDDWQGFVGGYPNRSHSINEGRNTSRHLYALLTRYLNDNLPTRPKP